MKKILFLSASLILSASAFASTSETASTDVLHETMAKSEAQKPETVHRIRDTISVGHGLASTEEDEQGPSVKAINSFSSFFEKRVKASNKE